MLTIIFQYSHSRLSHPYTNCKEPEYRMPHYLYTNKSYSVEGCYRTCLQLAAIKSCNCTDPRFPKPPDWPNEIPVCATDSACHKLFLNESADLNCDCSMECEYYHSFKKILFKVFTSILYFFRLIEYDVEASISGFSRNRGVMPLANTPGSIS